MSQDQQTDTAPASTSPTAAIPTVPPAVSPGGAEEIGGPRGPEPTRFGDWEKAGRCSDF